MTEDKTGLIRQYLLKVRTAVAVAWWYSGNWGKGSGYLRQRHDDDRGRERGWEKGL